MLRLKPCFKHYAITLLSVFIISTCTALSTDKSFAQTTSASGQDWVSEEWNGNARPYQNMQTSIENAAQQHLITSNLIQQYRVKYAKNPHDALSLFRWAATSYEARQLHPPIYQAQRPGPGAFQLVTSPQTYEFTRMRFLVCAEFTQSEDMVGVAKRLLKHNPNDYDVQYYLVKCFKPWISVQQKQQAVFFAHQLVQRYSNKPSAYAALGNIYYTSWVVSKKPSDAVAATVAYRKYLSLAPLNYEARPQVEAILRTLQGH